MTRYELINFIISKRGFKNYLEIGVDQGECFNRVKCEKKVGVDPYEGGRYPGGPATHVMTSDVFFKQNEVFNLADAFDIVFIDGLHEAAQVETDLENAHLHLAEGGVIIVHDCLPLSEEAQQVPRGDVWGWNGDAWRAILNARAWMDLSLHTVDTDQGCAVWGLTDKRVEPLPPANYIWEYFDTNRQELMNIISVSELLRIV